RGIRRCYRRLSYSRLPSALLDDRDARGGVQGYKNRELVLGAQESLVSDIEGSGLFSCSAETFRSCHPERRRSIRSRIGRWSRRTLCLKRNARSPARDSLRLKPLSMT